MASRAASGSRHAGVKSATNHEERDEGRTPQATRTAPRKRPRQSFALARPARVRSGGRQLRGARPMRSVACGTSTGSDATRRRFLRVLARWPPSPSAVRRLAAGVRRLIWVHSDDVQRARSPGPSSNRRSGTSSPSISLGEQLASVHTAQAVGPALRAGSRGGEIPGAPARIRGARPYINASCRDPERPRMSGTHCWW
jgi:hypothetical protein